MGRLTSTDIERVAGPVVPALQLLAATLEGADPQVVEALAKVQLYVAITIKALPNLKQSHIRSATLDVSVKAYMQGATEIGG